MAGLAAALLFALPAGLSAQADTADAEPPPLIGDRPDFTESASVVSRLQLEAGYTVEEVTDVEVHTMGELLVRVPAASRLELRFGVPSWSWIDGAAPTGGQGSDGFTDPTVGVKLGLAEPGADGSGPSVALLAGANLPIRGAMGGDDVHPGGRLALGLDLSERLSLGTNAGMASAGEGEARHAELSGSVALGVGLTEAVGAYLETYGFARTGDGPPSSSVVNGGVTWLAGPDLQLDARVGTGLSGPAPDLILGTGIVWRP